MRLGADEGESYWSLLFNIYYCEIGLLECGGTPDEYCRRSSPAQFVTAAEMLPFHPPVGERACLLQITTALSRPKPRRESCRNCSTARNLLLRQPVNSGLRRHVRAMEHR